MASTTYLLLHDIRSVYNVGAIFRTADAAGISKIYLTGFTPTPVDRFGRKRKDFAKVALGAENSLAWEHVKEPFEILKKMKHGGVQIIGIEQSRNSVDYKIVKATTAVCFVVGSEVGGLSPTLRNYCHVLAEVPMCGKKDSLNVSVALGIALFRILNI